MLNKIKNILFSTTTMAVLMFTYAFAMGYATFVENDYGTVASKAVVYNAFWFEVVQVLLVVNFAGNIVRFGLNKKKKWPVLLFHLSFVFILIGAAITRYISFEGVMPIREGAQSDLMISDNTFLSLRVNNNKVQKYYEKKLFLSTISNNNFSEEYEFKDQDLEVDYVDFIPRASVDVKEGEGESEFLSLVVSQQAGRENKLLEKGKSVKVGSYEITWDNPKTNTVNILSTDRGLKIFSPFNMNILRMMDSYKAEYPADTLIDFSQRILYNTGTLSIVMQKQYKNAAIQYVSNPDKNSNANDLLLVDVKVGEEQKRVEIFGKKGVVNPGTKLSMGGLNIDIAYGSVFIRVPFSIRLNDFQLDRYPGSNSPASYASEVTLLDKDLVENHRIFMNNVLDYKGYRFFQSSYDTDEKGTVLSVNHDSWGTWVTYLGYFLLSIGMFWTLFAPGSRFTKLNKDLKKMKLGAFLLLFSMASFNSFGQAPSEHMFENIDSIIESNKIDQKHADNFGNLVIQDNGGRLKPVNTFASELMRKVYRKDTYNGLDADQVLLSIILNPIQWQFAPIIKVDDKTQVDEFIGVEGKYARFYDFFDEMGKYKLAEAVEEAYQKKPNSRGTFDKEIIKVDERVNVFYLAFQGNLMRFFPIPNDENNTWVSYKSDLTSFQTDDSLFVSNIMLMYYNDLKNAIKTGDYTQANSKLEYIRLFQKKYGSDVLPGDDKIMYEVLYNKYKPFQKLFPYYMLVGLFMLIISFIQLFKNNKALKYSNNFFFGLIGIGFIIHTIGLAIRWYISGHAPWSNGYESMIYISWATVLAGFIFARQSRISLAATALLTSLILMVSHLNWLDPEVTNIVPVLNSYWLMIHVAIITASYGFVGLGALLGFLVLVIYIFINDKNKAKLNSTIKELSIINEMTLTIGLFMLTIGTFLGGVWANESWGRYWGWDPKETWAFVSVFVYALVLHLRLVPKMNSRYIFNLASVVAFSSIIMTYFGVNYYLSGLHSYAAGDPMPIPNFVYYSIVIVFITAILAYWRKSKI
jgi:cytochrome c-type biogenesis protein CcsB